MALMAAATRNTLSYNSSTKQKASQKVGFIIAGCNFLYNLKNRMLICCGLTLEQVVWLCEIKNMMLKLHDVTWCPLSDRCTAS